MNRYNHQDGGYCPHCGRSQQVHGYGTAAYYGGNNELEELRRRVQALEMRLQYMGMGNIGMQSQQYNAQAARQPVTVGNAMPQATPGNPVCGEK